LVCSISKYYAIQACITENSYVSTIHNKWQKVTKHTTVSGTPGGGMGKFLGGAPVVKERLSKRHSPIVPYVNLPY
jgi:hypothetical protein